MADAVVATRPDRLIAFSVLAEGEFNGDGTASQEQFDAAVDAVAAARAARGTRQNRARTVHSVSIWFRDMGKWTPFVDDIAVARALQFESAELIERLSHDERRELARRMGDFMEEERNRSNQHMTVEMTHRSPRKIRFDALPVNLQESLTKSAAFQRQQKAKVA